MAEGQHVFSEGDAPDVTQSWVHVYLSAGFNGTVTGTAVTARSVRLHCTAGQLFSFCASAQIALNLFSASLILSCQRNISCRAASRRAFCSSVRLNGCGPPPTILLGVI